MRPFIRKVVCRDDVDQLVKEAEGDNHYPLAPTHLVIKDGKIAGYASVCGMPTTHFWAHSERMKAGDSLRVIREFEKMLCEMGHKQVIVPVAADSPFYPMMEKIGYHKLFETTLFGRIL